MSESNQTTTTSVALVTGGAQRIGRDIALALARDGWDVAIHYGHSEAAANDTVRAIENLGRRACALACDLSLETDVRALLPRCMAALGPVHCVVNNASTFEYDTATHFSSEGLIQQMRVNTAAPIVLAQNLHAALCEQAHGVPGVVINLLDQKLWNPNPDFLSYTLSKGALKEATRLLAMALAPRVRVVGVAPGITLPSGAQSEASFERAHQRTVLGASSTPNDIAQAVCYLARAHAVTGTTVLVDGGQHLTASPRDVMFTS